MSVRAAIAVVAGLAVGCAGPIYRLARPAHPARTFDEAALHERKAACVSFNLDHPGARLQVTPLEACAQVGTPGTTPDDHATPLLALQFADRGVRLANPGSWHLTVTAPDGAVAVDRTLDSQDPEDGLCDFSGCWKYASALVAMPAPWTAGTYRIRLVCAFQPAYVADMALTLNPFAPGRPREEGRELDPAR